MSVSAINPTSIQVTFNNDLTAEQAAKSNFTLSKGTIEAVNVTGNVATISVSGLTYGNETTVTVGNPAHTQTVTVPAVSDLYKLDIKTDAPDNTIKSDGSTKTQITVTLIDKLTDKVVTDKDGILQFSATRGGLGQTTSALQNGVATVQLTSEASAVSQTSTVTVTVSNVPGAAEFEGLTGQLAVFFTPDGAKDPGQVSFVTAVSADSSQGDRLFVVFSDEIKAADYKKAVADNAATKGAPTALEYGIQVNDETVAVSDVVQKTPTTLEFILDTDVVGNAVEADYNRIEAGWNGPTAGKNYLRDNVEHKVSFPASIGNLVLANTGANLKFILTDTSKPGVLGVSAKDQLEFSVRFTESMDETTIEKLVGGKNPNFLLDGREVLVKTGVVSAADVVAAKAANQVILTSLQVGNYSILDKDGKVTAVVDNAVKAVDTRNVTTFKVHKDFALADGVHEIQISKVGDWAQDVDQTQNLIATDTFGFTVEADKSVPVAEVVVQSAEQWLVKFDKPVYTTGSKTAKEVFALKSADKDDKFEFGTDYIVSTIDKDGEVGTPLAAGDSISGEQYFLIEFTKDWTVKYDTAENPLKTYFASTKNPYIVTLDHLESAIGNKVGKKELDVKLSYDGDSPKIDKANQVKTAKGEFTSDVRVVMSEPVKNVIANNEGLTPSQQQDPTEIGGSTGVPVPTYEFVKGDKVVKAEVESGSASYDNYAFTLEPEAGATLEAGEWTLFIRSISDDIGNTSATESHKVTIEAADQAVTGTRLAWAAFDDAAGDNKLLNDDAANFDVIYVKFTKVMKAGGEANSVGKTQNYLFMGQPLPEGSSIQKGITGVTKDYDGVTILMPKGTWNGTEHLSDGTTNNFTNNLNIASNFVSADGEKLSGKYAVELTDTTTTTTPDTLGNGFEATYSDAGETNKPSQVTFGGQAHVTGATVKSAGITPDGKIDEIELKLDQNTKGIVAGTEVFVNGKTFEVGTAAAGAVTVTLTAKSTSDQIEGSATTGLKITGKDGSIIVNTGSVEDEAAPVITSAVLSDDKKEITVTFSEAVTNNTDGTFGKVLAAAFNVGGTVATKVEHDEATPNKVVLTISNGDALTLTSTVAATATAVQDFAKATTPATVWTVAFSSIKGATDPVAEKAAAIEAADLELAKLTFSLANSVDDAAKLAVAKAQYAEAKDKVDAAIAKGAAADGSEFTADHAKLALQKTEIDRYEAAAGSASAIAAINAGTATAADYTAAGITGVTVGNLNDVNAAVAAAKTTKGSDLIKSEIQDEVDAVVLLATQAALLASLGENDFEITNTNVGYTNDADFLAASLALNTLTDLGVKDTDYSVEVTAFTAATNHDTVGSEVNGKYTIEFTLSDGTTKVTFTDAVITATTVTP